MFGVEDYILAVVALKKEKKMKKTSLSTYTRTHIYNAVCAHIFMGRNALFLLWFTP